MTHAKQIAQKPFPRERPIRAYIPKITKAKDERNTGPLGFMGAPIMDKHRKIERNVMAMLQPTCPVASQLCGKQFLEFSKLTKTYFMFQIYAETSNDLPNQILL